MHVLPEVYTLGAHSHDDLRGDTSHLVKGGERSKPSKVLDTAVLAAGTVIPLLICLFLDEHA